MNVKFSPQAKADLIAIHAYIADQDALAAARILSRLRQVTDTLGHFPTLGRPGAISETREFAVPGLPYTVVYRVVSTAELDIVTILHQRRLYPPSEE
ncbi:type II toxin-antitoxin system RelE/ParE family toxin [Rhizobium sp. TH135]|uniref:type II toxin-antitoxin system RelE/ParE family toxin n=1 Tax=Rhizobium sp. TH135 TaxID=2067451 RepID=UPI000C7A607C|nr:type II toxin-antitoxin system RelE/ParE family toxin [Rhizobium sp. TH135]PLK70786.1 type II toxin-antitoxin system RelE/ParE family toxin [Rhizobium sp. TH135]